MTRVYITIGIPASGKSTHSRNRVEDINGKAIRFSSDDIRKAYNKPDHAEVFRIMRKGLREAVESNYYDEIYYDATNVNRKKRRGLYREIKSWDKEVEVFGVFFSIPLFESLKRNSERNADEKVPEHIILRMHRQLQVPRVGVDCDEIIVKGIPIFEEVSGVVENPTRVENIFNNMNHSNKSRHWVAELWLSNTEHSCPPWHLEDVFTHINMCIENASSPNLKQVALFHDLAKGITKEKDETGYATYRGHADVGSHYLLNYLGLTKYIGSSIPDHELDKVEVVHQHMNAHNGLGQKNIRNNRLSKAVQHNLRVFAEIDSMSKITESETKREDALK